MTNKNDENINEISKKLVNAYTDKAIPDIEDRERRQTHLKHTMNSKDDFDLYKKIGKIQKNRIKSLGTALNKYHGTAKVNATEDIEMEDNEDIENVNEISKDLASNYISKAVTRAGAHNFMSGAYKVATDAAQTKKDKSSADKGYNKNSKKAFKMGQSISLAGKKLAGKARVNATEEFDEDDENYETVNEQTHKIEAVYTDKHEGVKKKGILKVQANSKAAAKNKVGVYLSKGNCDVHSLTHVESYDIEGEEVNEGKTYRTDSDNSFSSRVRNSMKKKADKAAKDRATQKREVE